MKKIIAILYISIFTNYLIGMNTKKPTTYELINSIMETQDLHMQDLQIQIAEIEECIKIITKKLQETIETYNESFRISFHLINDKINEIKEFIQILDQKIKALKIEYCNAEIHNKLESLHNKLLSQEKNYESLNNRISELEGLLAKTKIRRPHPNILQRQLNISKKELILLIVITYISIEILKLLIKNLLKSMQPLPRI